MDDDATMPAPPPPPSPEQHARQARQLLDRADRVDPPLAQVCALQGIGEALLAIAGQLAVIQEHGAGPS